MALIRDAGLSSRPSFVAAASSAELQSIWRCETGQYLGGARCNPREEPTGALVAGISPPRSNLLVLRRRRTDCVVLGRSSDPARES